MAGRVSQEQLAKDFMAMGPLIEKKDGFAIIEWFRKVSRDKIETAIRTHLQTKS